MLWSQHHPRSIEEPWGFRFHAQTGRSNFTFTYWDLSRALTIHMSPQCWAYTQALKREKSVSPLYPDPVGAVVTNDWCIRCIRNLTQWKNYILIFKWVAQANLVLIAYASSEGSGEPAHLRSLARTFAARSYKQWIKRNLQTESQIPGPSECLGMRS